MLRLKVPNSILSRLPQAPLVSLQRSPHSLVGFKGPTSDGDGNGEGREGKGKKEGKVNGGKREGREGREGKGRGGE